MIPSIPTQQIESTTYKIRCDETSSDATLSSETQGELIISLKNSWEKMREAFAKGQYAEALMNLENIEGVCDDFVEDLRFAVTNLMKGQFGGRKAIFMALMQDPKALSLCDKSFEQLKAGSERAIAIALKTGEHHGIPSEQEIQKIFEIAQLFYRGMMELSLGEREGAIRDLRSSLQVMCNDVWKGLKRPEYVEMCFLLKILEQKLGVSLIPQPEAIDPNDKMSLFLAGRYQEALDLITNPPQIEDDLLFTIDYWVEDRFRQSSDIILYGAILTLTGKSDEALAWFEQHPSDCYGYNQKTLLALTHFAQGEYQKTRDALKPLSDESDRYTDFLIPIPFLGEDNASFVRSVLPLAIRGFED